MKNLIMLAALLLGLGSCQKEGTAPVTHETPSPITTSSALPPSPEIGASGTVDPSNDYSQTPGAKKVSPSDIPSATGANQIASRFFGSASIYKDAYIHLHQ